jgi:hypothetical protein
MTVVICGNMERGEIYAAGVIDRRVRVLFDPDGTAETAFASAQSYPLAFVVDSGGVVRARQLVAGWEALETLVRTAVSGEGDRNNESATRRGEVTRADTVTAE